MENVEEVNGKRKLMETSNPKKRPSKKTKTVKSADESLTVPQKVTEELALGKGSVEEFKIWWGSQKKNPTYNKCKRYIQRLESVDASSEGEEEIIARKCKLIRKWVNTGIKDGTMSYNKRKDGGEWEVKEEVYVDTPMNRKEGRVGTKREVKVWNGEYEKVPYKMLVSKRSNKNKGEEGGEKAPKKQTAWTQAMLQARKDMGDKIKGMVPIKNPANIKGEMTEKDKLSVELYERTIAIYKKGATTSSDVPK